MVTHGITFQWRSIVGFCFGLSSLNLTWAPAFHPTQKTVELTGSLLNGTVFTLELDKPLRSSGQDRVARHLLVAVRLHLRLQRLRIRELQ